MNDNKNFPLSYSVRFATFSRNIMEGSKTSAIRIISKNRLPLLSTKPFWLPHTEKDWHGKPAVITSAFSRLFALIFLISFFINSVSGKLCSYVLHALGSFSFAQTISNPVCLNPKSIPLIPEINF